MRLQNLVLTALLLLFSAALLPAQNTLPDAHNDACWSSLSALRGCQLKAGEQAQAYAQRCTSYPEYQCFDYYQPQPKPTKTAAKVEPNKKHTSPVASTEAAPSADEQVQSSGTN